MTDPIDVTLLSWINRIALCV